jgi:anthranilate phosphoribosyltransferase
MIEEAIRKAEQKQGLSREEAKQVFDEIMHGKAGTEKIAALLKALAEKGESIDEIQGAAESMRAVVAKVKPNVEQPLLDVVGTGGDKKHTINISTAAAIVAAGAGCLVAKHGNRSISSKCGAADVLEKLGVNIECSNEKNARLIEKIGIAFLFAPCHHPAMRFAMPARKQLGTRTIFNILGPITNPAGAQTCLLGCFDLALAEKLARALAGLGAKHALVVHGMDGCDEISICAPTAIFEVKGGKVQRYEIAPEQFGFARCREQDIAAGTVEEAAGALMRIIEGKEQGCKRNVVLLNAGAAIYANGKAASIASGIEKARQSIDSGKALEKLRQLIGESNRQVL